MAKTRKDERGRALRKGEVQRASEQAVCTPILIRWAGVGPYTHRIWQRFEKREAADEGSIGWFGSVCCR